MLDKDIIYKRRRKLLQAFSFNSPVYELFDCIEHVSFFAKDRDGVLLAANRYLIELYEFRCEDELIGHTDFDLLPRRLAEKFRQDDLQIMESGKPARKIVELFMNRQGIPSWFLTSKYPIRSTQGKVIGIMGIIQDYDARKDLFAEEPELRTALAHLHDHFRDKVSIQTLAKHCQLSLRQFECRFQARFNRPHNNISSSCVFRKRANSSCSLHKPLVPSHWIWGFMTKARLLCSLKNRWASPLCNTGNNTDKRVSKSIVPSPITSHRPEGDFDFVADRRELAGTQIQLQPIDALPSVRF